MNKKLQKVLIFTTVIGLILSSSIATIFLVNQTRNMALTIKYKRLLKDYENFFGFNETFQLDYSEYFRNYNKLLLKYNYLKIQFDSGIENKKMLPILDKMVWYYNSVRLTLGTKKSTNNRFAANLILHGSSQYNAFEEVEKILGPYNFWTFGDSLSDTKEAYSYCLEDWQINENSSLGEIFEFVSNNIEYRFDSEIFEEDNSTDIYLSPLETLFYREGDCEDSAILAASLLESHGYNVKFVSMRDNDYYPGGLFHAFLFVEIGQEIWEANIPDNPAWSFNRGRSYDWIILDPTSSWQSNPWYKPSWLSWYHSNSISNFHWLKNCDWIDCDT